MLSLRFYICSGVAGDVDGIENDRCAASLMCTVVGIFFPKNLPRNCTVLLL